MAETPNLPCVVDFKPRWWREMTEDERKEYDDLENRALTNGMTSGMAASVQEEKERADECG